MFNKRVPSTAQHALSAQDRRRLMAAVAESAAAGESEALFAGWPQVTLNRLKGVKTVVYTRGGEPVLFTAEAGERPLPALPALAQQPRLLSYHVTLKPGVELFLARGANLMWPGVAALSPEAALPAGAAVAVFTAEGAPCAVGIATESRDRTQGVAVCILHHAGDELAKQIACEPESADTAEEAPPMAADSVVSTADVDAALREAFLNCLHLTLLTDGFVENGQLWLQHLLPCRAPGAAIDPRRSSFKKLSAFLKAMEAEGLLVYSEGSKKSPPGIARVRRDAPAIRDHKPTAALAAKQEKPAHKTRVEIRNWVLPSAPIAAVLKIDCALTPRGDFRRAVEAFLKRKKALRGEAITAPAAAEELLQLAQLPAPVATLGAALAALEKVCGVRHTVRDGASGAERTVNGAFERLQLVSEKRGNHFCTRVRGLEHWGIAPALAMSALQPRLDTGVSAQETASGVELVFQGTFLAPLRAALHQLFGIEEDCVALVDKAKRVVKNPTKR